MNIASFLKGIPAASNGATTKAHERFRQRELSATGSSMTINFLPRQQEEIAAKMKALLAKRDADLDASAERRAEALKTAKAEYDGKVRAINDGHRREQAQANKAYDDAEDALTAEFSAPLSKEQIAHLMAKPGDVVRVAQ